MRSVCDSIWLKSLIANIVILFNLKKIIACTIVSNYVEEITWINSGMTINSMITKHVEVMMSANGFAQPCKEVKEIAAF